MEPHPSIISACAEKNHKAEDRQRQNQRQQRQIRSAGFILSAALHCPPPGAALLINMKQAAENMPGRPYNKAPG